jgi:hypothetical protein
MRRIKDYPNRNLRDTYISGSFVLTGGYYNDMNDDVPKIPNHNYHKITGRLPNDMPMFLDYYEEKGVSPDQITFQLNEDGSKFEAKSNTTPSLQLSANLIHMSVGLTRKIIGRAGHASVLYYEIKFYYGEVDLIIEKSIDPFGNRFTHIRFITDESYDNIRLSIGFIINDASKKAVCQIYTEDINSITTYPWIAELSERIHRTLNIEFLPINVQTDNDTTSNLIESEPFVWNWRCLSRILNEFGGQSIYQLVPEFSDKWIDAPAAEMFKFVGTRANPEFTAAAHSILDPYLARFD